MGSFRKISSSGVVGVDGVVGGGMEVRYIRFASLTHMPSVATVTSVIKDALLMRFKHRSPYRMQQQPHKCNSNFTWHPKHPSFKHPSLKHPSLQHPSLQHPSLQHPSLKHPSDVPSVRPSLHYSLLRELPHNIGQLLPNITELNISHNRLTHLPDGLCMMPKLRQLSVEANRLTQLPPSFWKMYSLEALYAGGARDGSTRTCTILAVWAMW